MEEKNMFDLGELTNTKCLLVKENGEMEILNVKNEDRENYEVISKLLFDNIGCKRLQLVPSIRRDIEIYLDNEGKINDKCKLNEVASKLFDMSQIPDDIGLFGNVIFTKKGMFP